MTAHGDTDVVITGAGPTGLVLALDLARRGVRALLLERADGLFPGSRGKGLQPRSQEVLDDLGVLPEVLAAGGPYPRMLAWEGTERRGEWDMIERSEPTERVPYANTLLIPQSRTQELLYARLTALGGGVRFGAALTGLRQDDAGVEALLSTGETIRAAFLVGADGGRSTVRRALGVGMTGETVDPRPMLVADVRISPCAVADRDHWHVWRAADGGVALCPLPGGDGLFQLAATFEDADAGVDTTPDGVRALLAARTPLAAEEITEVPWASDYRARAALADRFREGRVFLAGDAAHVHSPAGGQGLNTGVQDAYNLGWKLAQVLRHGAPAALLDSYEAERRPVAADVLGLSTRLHRATADGDAPQRGRDVQQLGVGYRDSALAVDTRAQGPGDAVRAGDRAPDGPHGDGRLFDLFRGPHFTLLAVGPAEPPSLLPEQVRAARLTAYEPYGPGLFLIRPDGYVGWAGARADASFDAYLATVGLTLAGVRA
ncbi:FAD-dependent monooxygenase [Streptomyces sp. G2]|uniref:FAD-dependent monooxygenase n=1 Tax=Streptomyces sp. G2 TaxID=1684471 RepID=UPI00202FC436|nr:FAD-dependent monooxygenase [Streptomyces sp. G2]MCM1950278.1 FAD-dependent monooxygenase [Streptomyces sp. G2]